MRLPFNGSWTTNNAFNDPRTRQTYVKAFGWYGHNGIDYPLPCGTPVVAPMGGVVFRGWEPNGYGNYIFIRSGNLETVLGHLSSFSVAHGQSVGEGQLIARSGSTGFSSGCHLHWGVRPLPANTNNGFGGYVDPRIYLAQTNKEEETVEVWRDTHDVRVNGYGAFGIEVAGNDPALLSWVGKSKLDFYKGLAAQVRNTFNAKNAEIERLKAQATAGFAPVGELYIRK